MIRTKVVQTETLPKWRKDGRGSFRMASGKIIKPNQIFSAKESEIPEGFRNLVIQIEPGTEEESVQSFPQKPAFEIQPITPAVQKLLDDFNIETDAELNKQEVAPIEVAEPGEAQIISPDPIPSEKVLIHGTPELQHIGAGWYNIVNAATGKILNEKHLRKADAEKMLMNLLG